MCSIIKDVSILTTIPEELLNKLIDKGMWCICHNIEESLLENNGEPVIADIGIGKLLIKNDEEQVKYKFIPDTKLEEYINKTILENKNPLKLTLEKTLGDKINNTYKTIV